jgi:Metallo-peptidase family M12B Reprolysin-like
VRHFKRLLVAAGIAIGILVSDFLTPPSPAMAGPGPVTGNTPWLVLLCKTFDQLQEPQTTSYYSTFFTPAGAGQSGMFDYWRDVSYGQVNLAGSQVLGWYTTGKTTAQVAADSRPQKLKDCFDTAKAANPNLSGSLSGKYGVIAVYNTILGTGDSGAAGNGKAPLDGGSYAQIVLEPWALYPTFVAHEMGHGYGLDHSFDTVLNSCGGAPGEYCDAWDVMSAMSFGNLSQRSPTFETPTFETPWTAPDPNVCGVFPGGLCGPAGPGLKGPNLDALGWVPDARIARIPSVQLPTVLPLQP